MKQRRWRYGPFRALLLVAILLLPDLLDPIARTTPFTLRTAATHDDAGMLETVTAWTAEVFSYAYTADGLLDTVARPNGISSDYGYDAANRLTTIVHADTIGTLAAYGYAVDANGNRTRLDLSGPGSPNGYETYGYDSLDRLTDVRYPDAAEVEYSYDANGNRTQVTSGSEVTDYSYDAADQLTSIETLLLTYDGNGNRISAGTNAFAYDWSNRLTGATMDGSSVSYGFLGDDTRVTETTGSSTNLVYDRASGLPNLVDDGTVSYLHAGPGLAAEVSNASGDTSYPLQDGLVTVASLPAQLRISRPAFDSGFRFFVETAGSI